MTSEHAHIDGGDHFSCQVVSLDYFPLWWKINIVVEIVQVWEQGVVASTSTDRDKMLGILLPFDELSGGVCTSLSELQMQECVAPS